MIGALRAILFCAFVSLFALNANAAKPIQAGKGDVVFQIGTVNRSSIEFSQSCLVRVTGSAASRLK